jgi:hypothetical protein
MCRTSVVYCFPVGAAAWLFVAVNRSARDSGVEEEHMVAGKEIDIPSLHLIVGYYRGVCIPIIW